VSRFTFEHPPGPGDAIYDEAKGDEAGPAAVAKIGHAQTWIAGVAYEHDRILDLLHREGMTAAIHLISA